jgi:hypothetical protein
MEGEIKKNLSFVHHFIPDVHVDAVKRRDLCLEVLS